ncbi:MAG: DUF3310 domain-containing protein [Puniceicoccales bacterium]
MTPYQKAGFNELSLFRVTDAKHSCCGQIVWLSRDDGDECPWFSSYQTEIQHHHFNDLEELPKDADGFYLWDGGECPVPGDWMVQIKQIDGELRQGSSAMSADGWMWGVVTAFKPISRPDMPRHSESAEQPESPAVVEDSGDICGDTVSALDVQEGGDHYKKLKIQPMEYSMANNLDACQHTIVKYVTRFRDKGGIEDLRKAKHCIDMLIEFEQQENKQ